MSSNMTAAAATTTTTTTSISLPPELAQPVDCLLIDNFDSFTWNLYQQLSLLGARVTVIRNDAIPAAALAQLDIKSLLISPGPGHPTTDSGISRDAIRYFTGKVPVLGVCMGLECIVDVYGGTIGYAGEIKHGKLSPIRHDGRGCFKDIPQRIPSTRYHSLSASLKTLPKELMVTCITEESGVIMGIRHREFVLEAVQYHPESILSEGGDAFLRNFLSLKGGTWQENPDALVLDTALPPFPYDALTPSVENAAELKAKVPTILERIYEQRLKDVQHTKSLPGSSSHDLDAYLALHLAPPLVPLVQRLKARSPSLMAEIKRASPSKGDIAPNANAAQQALTYALAGAAVISVLTEPTWFKGSLFDMRLARQAIDGLPNRPAILRKDFVLDEYQIAEARLWGADTVLLIVAMLPHARLHALYAYSLSLGMEPLVEVHTTDEMRIALELGAKVIGVNNRNLHDFNVDMGTTTRLADMARGDVTLCALSGISGPEDVRGYVKEGVGAVLVGEALMRAEDPRAFIHHLLDLPLPKDEEKDEQVLVKICGIRSADEALVAAEAGADLLGLVFVPSSKRRVSVDVAQSIASAIHAFRSSRNTPPSANVNADVGAETQKETETAEETETEKETETETETETEIKTETKTETATGTEVVVEQDVGNTPWFANHARRLVRALAHRRPLLVGVFQDASLHVVQETVTRVGLDLVQLHGAEPIEWARFVGVPVVRAFHVSAGTDANRVATEADGLRDVTRPGLHAFVLLDAQRSDGLSGGSGETIDWVRARALVDAGELGSEAVLATGHGDERSHEQAAKTEAEDGDENAEEDKGRRGADADADVDTPHHARMSLILAGGLEPSNVAEAIAQVHPWAVDVSGGVEREDGTGKDAEKFSIVLYNLVLARPLSYHRRLQSLPVPLTTSQRRHTCRFPMVMDVDSDFHVPFHCAQLAPVHIAGWDYTSVPELVVLPEIVPQEDAQALGDTIARLHNASNPSDIERCLRELALAWEDYYLPKFPVPFFQVRVADVRAAGGSLSTALELYDEVLHSIDAGPQGAPFTEFVAKLRSQAQGDAEKQAHKSDKLQFFQHWKHARAFASPFLWPMLPASAPDILNTWQTSRHQRQLLNYSWLQAIHIDQDCELTTESVEALTRYGFIPSLVQCAPGSELKDPDAIVNTMLDLDQAYTLVMQLIDRVEQLTTESIKAIHSKLMRSSKIQTVYGGQFTGAVHYVNAGLTRQATQKSAVVRSHQYNLAFCPTELVDQQLDYICKMGRQYIARWRNPFATAAWIHVTFTRCHPFDDGNGRMARLLSSIPLVRHGFPPVCISPMWRGVYYESMNTAWEGDYLPLINCMVESIKASLTDVERIMA
ncbi:indole-3-glycerol phosphate synthase-domain-containing protein [Butyriboletus roseoflavus]|nr:indole-3-glycerol phosphate synthase-domain-containing protein [Butyriboletus roseoflavus]